MITMVAAMAVHGVIGFNEGIPFDLKADRRHFMMATRNHIVVMGRKTFEGIGKPLPYRNNVVLTRNMDWTCDNVTVLHDLETALKTIQSWSETREVMIIGGEQIYTHFLPFAHKMILTHVQAKVDGDTYFPTFSKYEWIGKTIMHHEKDDTNQYPFIVRTYTRNKK